MVQCQECSKDLTNVRPHWSIANDEGAELNYCEECYTKQFLATKNLERRDWEDS